MTPLAWRALLVAAFLEVAGDAVVRRGLRGRSVLLILVGGATLGCYGVVVNLVNWDFSKLIGAYVGFFALVSVLCGRLLFKEVIPFTTWLGLALVSAGGLVIQYGKR